ncbi:MAG: glycosyltransferase [Gammaproteobacteria bacterium]|nr:glycosyltransferase [Gammaproteobacteria bacterium]
MKILHVTPTYIPAYRYGGPIYSVHGLCNALAALGAEVDVLTTNVDGAFDSPVPLGRLCPVDEVNVWYFPSKFMRRTYWSPKMRQHLLKTIRHYDIVHLHSVFLWPTLMAARIAKRYGVPYIVSPRGMLFKDLIKRKGRLQKNVWIKLFERSTIEHAAAIHLTSDIEVKALGAFNFNSPRLINIPNGINVDIASPKPHHVGQNKKADLIYLGRVNWKKGLDRLIQALVHLPTVNVIIAGNDEENYSQALKKLAQQLMVEKQIHFKGAVLGEDKKRFLEEAKILVLPSYSENFGNVVLEAMVHQCAVIVTPEVGIAQEINKYNAGLVSSGEPKILAENIKSLLSNNEQRKEFTTNANAMIQEKYTWSVVASNMLNEYKTIVEATG